MKRSKREALREKRRRQQLVKNLTWVGLGAVVLVVLGFALWPDAQPAVGEAAAIMPDTSHVEEGSDPGPYNTNPPTSGKHYANQYTAGFYDENSAEAQVTYPEGYLVHSLEHGYVIFWYNCDLVSESECTALKEEIRQVMDASDNFKVIAFPRPSIDVPVAMTSWGRILEFDSFDTQQAENFVQQNRNQAPEPDAP